MHFCKLVVACLVMVSSLMLPQNPVFAVYPYPETIYLLDVDDSGFLFGSHLDPEHQFEQQGDAITLRETSGHFPIAFTTPTYHRLESGSMTAHWSVVNNMDGRFKMVPTLVGASGEHTQWPFFPEKVRELNCFTSEFNKNIGLLYAQQFFNWTLDMAADNCGVKIGSTLPHYY